MRPKCHVRGMRFHFKRMLITRLGQKTLVLNMLLIGYNFLSLFNMIMVSLPKYQKVLQKMAKSLLTYSSLKISSISEFEKKINKMTIFVFLFVMISSAIGIYCYSNLNLWLFVILIRFVYTRKQD